MPNSSGFGFGFGEHFNFSPEVFVKNHWDRQFIGLIRQTPWWQADRPGDVLG